MRTLREIVDDFERLSAEAGDYYEVVVKPRVEAAAELSPGEAVVALQGVLDWLCLECVGLGGEVRDVPCEVKFPVLGVMSFYHDKVGG